MVKVSVTYHHTHILADTDATALYGRKYNARRYQHAPSTCYSPPWTNQYPGPTNTPNNTPTNTQLLRAECGSNPNVSFVERPKRQLPGPPQRRSLCNKRANNCRATANIGFCYQTCLPGPPQRRLCNPNVNCRGYRNIGFWHQTSIAGATATSVSATQIVNCRGYCNIGFLLPRHLLLPGPPQRQSLQPKRQLPGPPQHRPLATANIGSATQTSIAGASPQRQSLATQTSLPGPRQRHNSLKHQTAALQPKLRLPILPLWRPDKSDW